MYPWAAGLVVNVLPALDIEYTPSCRCQMLRNVVIIILEKLTLLRYAIWCVADRRTFEYWTCTRTSMLVQPG